LLDRSLKSLTDLKAQTINLISGVFVSLVRGISPSAISKASIKFGSILNSSLGELGKLKTLFFSLKMFQNQIN